MNKPIKSPYSSLMKVDRVDRRVLLKVQKMLGVDQLVIICQSDGDPEIQVAGMNMPPAELKVVLKQLLNSLPDDLNDEFRGEFPLKD